MSVFQIAGLTICLTIAAALLIATVRRTTRRFALLPWLALWLLAAAALRWPEATTAAARLLGIGRGADVVLYTAVLAGLIIALRLSLGQRRLERQMTLIVREMALAAPQAPAFDESRSPSPSPSAEPAAEAGHSESDTALQEPR